jgi:hypothetical protein
MYCGTKTDPYGDNGRLCVRVARIPYDRFRGTEFDSRHYQTFCEVMSLERGPFSLVRITDELVGRNGIGSGLENRD